MSNVNKACLMSPEKLFNQLLLSCSPSNVKRLFDNSYQWPCVPTDSMLFKPDDCGNCERTMAVAPKSMQMAKCDRPTKIGVWSVFSFLSQFYMEFKWVMVS